MKYQFFDNDGKVTESEQKSYTDALKFSLRLFGKKSNCWKATPSIVRFRNMQKK